MKVAIIGGGLAGMITALQLAEQGVKVDIYEATERLGGKAGASCYHGNYEEHGYHVFFGFYANSRALLQRLNAKLIDHNHYYFIEKGQYPKIGKQGIMSLPHAFPFLDSLLWYYFMVDLASRKPLKKDIPFQRYLEKKWYKTANMIDIGKEHVMKGFSIDPSISSTKTGQVFVKSVLAKPKPMFSMLSGDLQTHFIEPFEKLLIELGVRIHKHSIAKKINISEKVDSITVDVADGQTKIVTADDYVLASQFEETRKLLNEDVLTKDPSLANIFQLESAHMVGLHIYLHNHTIPFLGLTFLSESKYALTFVEQTFQWSDSATASFSLISADFSELQNDTDEQVFEKILTEAQQYIPIEKSNIKRWHLSRNVDSPLYINVVNSWELRPEVFSAIPNLYFAGDYVRNYVDLATMEGAVISGIDCANAIAKKYGISMQPAREIKHLPITLLAVIRWLLLPVVAIIWSAAKLHELFRKKRK